MPERRIFYGWIVVYALMAVMTTTSGLAFYNLPVLLAAFVAERGFPVSLASAATASFFVASGTVGLAVGQIVDRYDPRYVIIAAGCGATLALFSISLLHEPWQLFAFYIFFGLCYGGCGLIPTTTIVTRWFEARRAMAMSVASTGLSLGGIVLTPIAALLIQKLGLAGAAPWLAAGFFLGVVPLIALVVRSKPEAMGLLPDGATHREGEARPAPAPNIQYALAWRSRFFIAIAGTYLFALGSQVGGIAHIYRLVQERADAETAAVSIAVLAGASLAGRLAAGAALSRLTSRATTLGLIAIQTVGLVLLAFVSGRWPIVLSVVLFGLTAGSMLMMQPLLLAEAFGTREIGRIYSLSLLAGVLGYAIAPTIMGLLYDASGGYALPYLAVAALSLVGMAILAASGPARH